MLRPILTIAAVYLAGAAHAASFDCVVNPSIVVGVASTVPGLLEEVLIDRGDIVKKGQILARLNADTELSTIDVMSEQAANTSEIEAQKARYKLALNRMERSKRLASQNVTSKDAVEEAIAQMEVSKLELTLAESRKRILELELARARTILSQKVIVSPIDGIVMDRKLYAGEYLDQNGKLATIAQLDPLIVEAFVADSEYSKFSVGLAVRVTVSEPRNEVRVGTVQVIDRVLDAASRTFGVRIMLPNTDNRLPAGQRCKVEFDAKSN